MDPGQEHSFHAAQSIRTLRPVPTPTPSSCNRFVVCARGDCRRQFSVRGRCDGGRRYCGPECARAARRLGLIRAGRAYQAKARGRELHAARQARYLERRRAVTHRRLPEPLLLPPSGNLSTGTSPSPADAMDTTIAVPDLSNSKASTACVSCGRRSSFVRLYFLDECRSSRTAPRRKRPATTASPSGRTNAMPAQPSRYRALLASVLCRSSRQSSTAQASRGAVDARGSCLRRCTQRCRAKPDGTPDLRPSSFTVPAPAFAGEVHRLRARFSPVNFTDFPRVRVPVNRVRLRQAGGR